MKRISAAALALCAMCLFCHSAFAERRVALVIGNSAYARVPRLTNPVNDATAMADMFKRAGFDAVELKLDLNVGEMRRTLRDFAGEARDTDVAIVYFAGHGIEIQGNNYLIPVDAALERDIDAFDEAIPLERILSIIEPARQLRLVILDACRDNPFAKSMQPAIGSRSIYRGLAKVDPDIPNTLIAFAAKAGSTANDGETLKNSPFTAALVKYLPTPGLDLRKAFGFVRDDVLKTTRKGQEPFIYGSLGGNDVALVPAPPAPNVDLASAARDYEFAAGVDAVAAWDSFLNKYPTGFYSDLARVRRDKLIERTRIEAEAKAPQEERKRPAPADSNPQLAAMSQDARLGQNVPSAEPRLPAGCAGAPPQAVSLAADTAKVLSVPEECGLKSMDGFKECQNCPEMVVVPAGEFMMGSSGTEIDQGHAAINEAPQHKVVIGERFAIGRFEVTRDQFAAFVEGTGYRASDRCFTLENNVPQERANRSFRMPGYAQAGNHPVVCVSWADAQAYVAWLSKTTGKSYRLPSESEFEYVARAGSTQRFGLTDDPLDLCRFANGADQSAKIAGLPGNVSYIACTDGYPFTAPVGSLKPNAFGLYDLIGNVWEWTADCFANRYNGAGADPAGRADTNCQARTARGGDWFSTAATLRPAVRAKASPDARYDDIGFRVVRALAQ